MEQKIIATLTSKGILSREVSCLSLIPNLGVETNGK